jgi:hypothetical protein
MANEQDGEKRTLLVRSDEAEGYAKRGYTFLTSMKRGGEWYTLLEEPERPQIPKYYPPKTTTGLLEED